VLAGSVTQFERYDEVYAGPKQIFDADAPVLILGGGRVGHAAAENLAREGVNYKIVEKRPGLIFEDEHYIKGDAADLDVLKRAGIDKARSVIITTHNDDMNIYLTFYCRQLRHDVQIISRATVEQNVSKLHRVGADLVMSYASMGAGAILNVLLPGEISVFTDGLVVFNTPVPPQLVGKSVMESKIRERVGCSIVALRTGKALLIGPEPKSILPENSELILVGTAETEKAFLDFASR